MAAICLWTITLKFLDLAMHQWVRSVVPDYHSLLWDLSYQVKLYGSFLLLDSAKFFGKIGTKSFIMSCNLLCRYEQNHIWSTLHPIVAEVEERKWVNTVSTLTFESEISVFPSDSQIIRIIVCLWGHPIEKKWRVHAAIAFLINKPLMEKHFNIEL